MSLSQDVLLCGADRHPTPLTPPYTPPTPHPHHRPISELTGCCRCCRCCRRRPGPRSVLLRGRNQISRAPHSSLLMCRVTPCFLSPGGEGGVRQTSSTGNFSLHLFLFFSSEFSVGAMRVNISRREDAVYFFGGGGGGGPGVVGGCFGRGEQVWGTEFPLFYPVKAQLPARQQRDWQLV